MLPIQIQSGPHWSCSVHKQDHNIQIRLVIHSQIKFTTTVQVPLACVLHVQTILWALISSAIPLLYCLYRIGIATFQYEQSSRLQHSLQDLASLLEYPAPDASKYHIGANLGAYTYLHFCVLASSEIRCTHIVQMKSEVHISQLCKQGDEDTGIPGHITVPISCRAFSLPLLFCFKDRDHLGHSQEV